MAEPVALALIVNDWLEVPDATQFEIQNTSSLILPVKMSPSKPTSFSGATYLEAWDRVSKMDDENHWVYSDGPGNAANYTVIETSGGGGAGYANSGVYVLTQTQIDNGITLSPTPASISDVRMTLDEQGGSDQSPSTDYTLTVALIEFTADMITRLYPGDTIRMWWN